MTIRRDMENGQQRAMLTPADFADVAAATEKRRERRFACDRVIDIIPCSSGGGQQRVELTDCSLRGLCFIAANTMSRGEQVLVKLMIGNEVRILLYTVRRCTPQLRGRFAIGADFTGYVSVPGEDESERVLRELLGREHPDIDEG